MNFIDANKDGRIQFSEFVQRFKDAFDSSAPAKVATAAAAAAARRPSFFLQPQPITDPWAREALTKLGPALVAAGLGDTTTVGMFTTLDKDGDGVLSHEEFRRGVRAALGDARLTSLGYSDADLLRLGSIIDANSSGAINYLEFTEALSHVPEVHAPTNWRPQITDAAAAQLFTAVAASAVAGPTGTKAISPLSVSSAGGGKGNDAVWQRGIIEQIVAILYQFRVELAAAFRMFDTDGGAWCLGRDRAVLLLVLDVSFRRVCKL